MLMHLSTNGSVLATNQDFIYRSRIFSWLESGSTREKNNILPNHKTERTGTSPKIQAFE